MKSKLSVIFLSAILVLAAGCKKCYYCQNSCKVCEDQHYYILVESQNLGTTYYKTYTDSLQGVGWSCRDTAFDKDMQVCADKNKADNTIRLKEESGYTCSPVD